MVEWRAIDHVQLCIPPGEEAASTARAFYGQALELDEIEKPESLADSDSIWFRAGGVELHLGIDAEDAGGSKRHPAFEVDETRIPGRERFTVRDPFYNRLELLELE